MCSRIRVVLRELWSVGQEMARREPLTSYRFAGEEFQMWRLSLTLIGGANACMLLICPLP